MNRILLFGIFVTLLLSCDNETNAVDFTVMTKESLDEYYHNSFGISVNDTCDVRTNHRYCATVDEKRCIAYQIANHCSEYKNNPVLDSNPRQKRIYYKADSVLFDLKVYSMNALEILFNDLKERYPEVIEVIVVHHSWQEPNLITELFTAILKESSVTKRFEKITLVLQYKQEGNQLEIIEDL